MRLICPNCDAQYEVPSEVIPEDGRDVQCSNCGDTWFQNHSDQEGTASKEVEESATVQPTEPETETEISQVREEIREAEQEEQPKPVEPIVEQSAGEYEEDEPDSIVAEPVARELDPAVVAVLKQEAEHEAEQRRNEQSAGLETQPDLGLQEAEDDASRRAREARERLPVTQDDAPVGTDSAIADTLASRRDLLPDVEEISSSLRSASDRQADDESDVDDYLEPQSEKRSFRRGFTLMILLAVILGAVYVMAPKITQSVPLAGPAVSGYVAIVDKGRAALGDRVKAILDWLDAKASSSIP